MPGLHAGKHKRPCMRASMQVNVATWGTEEDAHLQVRLALQGLLGVLHALLRLLPGGFRGLGRRAHPAPPLLQLAQHALAGAHPAAQVATQLK